MKALFGVVSLLVVLAIVGMLALKQLGAAKHPTGATATAAGTGAGSAVGTPLQQSQQLQKQVANDVAKALEQGAAARKEDAEK